MDVHTEYIDKLQGKVPVLQEYLEKRMCSNFTQQAYAYKPHYERHEVFNKSALNTQNIQTAQDFDSLLSLWITLHK